jgi:uncharacterized protein YlaI
MESNKLWLNKDDRTLIRKKKNGRMIACWVCPCCRPRVIASKITNRSNGTETWTLTAYQGDKIGLPGGQWRIRDVGEAHHNNPRLLQRQSVLRRNHRRKRKLNGLPDKFVSNYSYNGTWSFSKLRSGDGSVKWPCPNG